MGLPSVRFRPSLASRRRIYVPDSLKLADVAAADPAANVTMPGPDNLLHEAASTLPAGRLSSLTAPTSVSGTDGPAEYTSFPSPMTGGTLLSRGTLPIGPPS